jgi:hypothetical protein
VRLLQLVGNQAQGTDALAVTGAHRFLGVALYLFKKGHGLTQIIGAV